MPNYPDTSLSGQAQQETIAKLNSQHSHLE